MANIYTEPTWTTLSPETYPNKSYFDINSTSPMQVTGFIVNLLQYHFSTEDNIENSQLKNLLWNEDPSLSKIYVGRSDSRDTQVSSQLPGLFVERGDCKNTTHGTLSRSLINIQRNAETIPSSLDYCMALEGGHVILCEAVTGAASEALAEEVWRRLMYFGPAIQQDFVMSYFNTSLISKGQLKEDRSANTYITSVQVVWTKDYKWSLQQEQKI